MSQGLWVWTSAGFFFSFLGLKLNAKVCKSYKFLLGAANIEIEYYHNTAENETRIKTRSVTTKISALYSRA